MTLRESINNLIRTDQPESPTDLIFIFGSLVLLALQIYATQKQIQVPHFEIMLLALGGYKSIKVASNYQKGKANGSDTADKPAD